MVYIGERDRLEREQAAAGEAEYVFRSPEMTEAQRQEIIKAAAEKYNVSYHNVEGQAKAKAEPPKSYRYTGNTSSNLVPATKEYVGGQLKVTYKVGTPEEIAEEQYRQAEKKRFFKQVLPESERRVAAERVGRDVAAELFQKQIEKQAQAEGKPYGSVIFSTKAYAQTQKTLSKQEASEGEAGILSKAIRIVPERQLPSFKQRFMPVNLYEAKVLKAQEEQGGEYGLYGDRTNNGANIILNNYDTINKVDMGEIKKTPETKWYDLPSRTLQKAREIEFTSTFREKNLLKKFGAYGLGIISGYASIPFHPKQFIKGTFQFGKGLLLDTRETISAIKEEFRVNPFTFTGELTGQSLFFKTATPLLKRPFQILNEKINPNFIKYTETGTKVVEDVSIPTKLEKLQALESKKVPVVHTTLSPELQIGSILKPADIEKVTGWRRAIGQRSFYTSSPLELPIEKKLPSGEFIKISYKETPISPKYEPVLYGGYIGLGEGYPESVQFSILPQTPKAFLFRDTSITPTPKEMARLPIKELVKYQTERAGTYVAAENIKRLSTEGQFTTSVGLEGQPLFRIVSAEGELKDKFTYYLKQRKLPKILGGEPTTQSILKKVTKAPEKYVKQATVKKINIGSKDFKRIQTALKGEDITYTGGVARRIHAGKGAIRDIDVITNLNEGQRLAQKVATTYPNIYDVIQHEKYPEIYRLRNKITGKVVADFDPYKLAEEGLYKPATGFEVVEGVKVVKPEILLKSKAQQILKGKARGNKQITNIEQITGQPNFIETIKKQKQPPKVLQKIWGALTSKRKRINFIEAKFERIGAEDLSAIKGVAGKQPLIIDMEKYTKSYGTTRYVSTIDILKKLPLVSTDVVSYQSKSLMVYSTVSSQSKLPSSISKSLSYKNSLKSKLSSLKSSSISKSLLSSSSGSSVSSSLSSKISSLSSYSSSSSLSSSSSSLSSSAISSSSSSSSGYYSSGGSSTSERREEQTGKISYSKSSVQKQSGYNVLIKRKLAKLGKGKYKSKGYEQANEVPLTKEQAITLGASIVDTYANRSFTVKKANKPARLSNILVNLEILRKFRTSKKTPNIYVEKTEYAIDNPEEVRGIPYEAIRQRKLGLIQTKSNLIQKKRQAMKSQLLGIIQTKKMQNAINLLSSKRQNQTGFITKSKRGKTQKWI